MSLPKNLYLLAKHDLRCAAATCGGAMCLCAMHFKACEVWLQYCTLFFQLWLLINYPNAAWLIFWPHCGVCLRVCENRSKKWACPVFEYFIGLPCFQRTITQWSIWNKPSKKDNFFSFGYCKRVLQKSLLIFPLETTHCSKISSYQQWMSQNFWFLLFIIRVKSG